MKLLLTSGGLENQSIINALSDLLGKPFSESKVAFIPTAANLEDNDKWWLIDNLNELKALNFKKIDIVDTPPLPKKVWRQRLKDVDILFISGGNTYHLMYWFKRSGFAQELPELLKKKIYVGIGAGTVAITPSIINDPESKIESAKIGQKVSDDGLSLVDFMIEPHINNKYFPGNSFENLKNRAKNYPYPIYALDDNSAIKIDGDKIEVVSKGEWKKF